MGHVDSLYVAGPMRGYDLYNFPAFEDATRRLRGYFKEVFSPAEHDLESGFDPSKTLEEQGFDLGSAIEWDLATIKRVDMVVLLPGWEKSSGVALEIHFAKFLGKRVYTYHAVGDDLYELYPLGSRNDQPRFPTQTGTSNEVRVVNEKTGGEKGSKLERFDLIPVWPLTLLARLYGEGAKKYAERNWERGYDWSLSYAAAQRHLTQFWRGEDFDAETGVPHPINVIFHMMALVEFLETHPEMDNRP